MPAFLVCLDHQMWLSFPLSVFVSGLIVLCRPISTWAHSAIGCWNMIVSITGGCHFLTPHAALMSFTLCVGLSWQWKTGSILAHIFPLWGERGNRREPWLNGDTVKVETECCLAHSAVWGPAGVTPAGCQGSPFGVETYEKHSHWSTHTWTWCLLMVILEPEPATQGSWPANLYTGWAWAQKHRSCNFQHKCGWQRGMKAKVPIPISPGLWRSFWLLESRVWMSLLWLLRNTIAGQQSFGRRCSFDRTQTFCGSIIILLIFLTTVFHFRN